MNQFNGVQPQYQPAQEDDELMSAVNEYRQEKFTPPQPPQLMRPQQVVNQSLPNNQVLPVEQAINTLNSLWEQGQVKSPNTTQQQNPNTSIQPFEFSFSVNGVPVTVRIG